MSVPIQCLWTGGEFKPLPRFLPLARAAYGAGEVLRLAPVDERTDASHKQEFAWIRDVWQTLPESLAGAYQSPEHLRKTALIMTGWCYTRDYPCASRKEAVRLAAALKAEADEYAVVQLEDAVVRIHRAKSQAKNKMKRADWEASKADIMRWIGDLIGVDPKVLAARSEGVPNTAPSKAA